MHDQGQINLKGVEIILRIDSTNTIGWIKKGKMRFSPYNNLCIYLLAVEVEYNCKFTPVFVKSEDNRLADALTREFAGKSKMITPHGITYTIGKPSDRVFNALAKFLMAPTQSLAASGFYAKFEVCASFFPSFSGWRHTLSLTQQIEASFLEDNADFFCKGVQANGEGLSEFLELVLATLKKSISGWDRKRRAFEKIRNVYNYEVISGMALALASAVISRAQSVSGANIASSEGYKFCRVQVISRFGPFQLSEVDNVLIKRVRDGCVKDPEFAKPQDDFTPFHPALVLVWAACINPIGMREGRFPDGKSADFLLISVFKLATCLCSRGLRGKDFLMYKEKYFNSQQAVESPRFDDIIIHNDELQIKFKPPFTMLRSGRRYSSVLEVVYILQAHPATGITMTLRGLKNRKEANYKVDLELSRVKFRDICPVFHFFNIFRHRLKYFPNFNWRYIFAIPKVASEDLKLDDYGWVGKGTPMFFPFTRKRFGETWKDMWTRIFGGPHYNIHNMRQGLQNAISRSSMLGNLVYSEDLRRQTGNWKRPKNLIWESYGGHDGFLLDIKYKEVLDWDLDYLLGRLSSRVREDLLNTLLWVCRFTKPRCYSFSPEQQ
jgi:hypothetical protein